MVGTCNYTYIHTYFTLNVCICTIHDPTTVIGGFDRWTTGRSEPHDLHNSSFSIFFLLEVVFNCNIAQPVTERRSAFARLGVLCASPSCRPVEGRDGMQVQAGRRCAVDHIRHSALSRERLCAYPKARRCRLDHGECGTQNVGYFTVAGGVQIGR